MNQPRTFLFMPESAYGPTNNCIGIADELVRRGHRVVFAAESSWAGRLTPYGFEEELVDFAPPPPEDAGEQDAGQYWRDFVRDTAPQFRRSTREQLETVIAPIWSGAIDGVRYCEPALRELVARVAPDVIVEDNVLQFPALLTAGVPFVRIVSCQPLEVKGPGVPPVFSGLPAADTSDWPAYLAECERVHRQIWSDFDTWSQAQGAPPLPDLEFIAPGDLNLYVYPQEADYTDVRPLDATWHRLDSCVRRTEQTPQLPDGWVGGDVPLVYFSLGSLGSADVELMRRVLAVLATTPYRYVVSKGPLHEEIELADNQWGAPFVPQTAILPLVDAVITHGGNNTTTESLHFGRPMVLLPLFWDQYDNAQRMDELGFGIRLDTYGFADEDLVGALRTVLTDEALRTRVAQVGADVRARDGLRRAADLIEGAAR
ncbi:glycosyltransferase [Cellulomonas citrea]|uniref:glycosyltransferase n=1 Tax=Cellulomonas citrea TaxID=1909423 RepID=UPI00135C3BC2|nr:glycosyltransferase [Cellulomonas citrea]